MSNALPNDQSVLDGENEATWLAKNAKQQGFTAMRLFGIGDVNWNEGAALQTSPGACMRTHSGQHVRAHSILSSLLANSTSLFASTAGSM